MHGNNRFKSKIFAFEGEKNCIAAKLELAARHLLEFVFACGRATEAGRAKNTDASQRKNKTNRQKAVLVAPKVAARAANRASG